MGQPHQTSESHLFTQAEPPCKQKLSYQETNTLKSKPIKNDKNRSRELINSHNHSQKPQPSPEAIKFDHTYTSDQVPNEFTRLVKAYFNNFEAIEEYWRMAKLAAYQYLFESDISCVLDTAIHAFKQTIRKVKKSNRQKNDCLFLYSY